MSDDSNTNDFYQFDPRGASTTLRIAVSAERVEEFLRSLVDDSHIPPIELVDEVHLLISPEAIQRAQSTVPMPPELADTSKDLDEFIAEAFAPRSDLPPPSPLFEDEAFASIAGRLESVERLFKGLCAVLIEEKAITNDRLFEYARQINFNFKEIMNNDDRVLAADRITVERFRAFAEMLNSFDEPDED